MKRLKLLGLMVLLLALIALVVALASPVAPVVGAAPEIEALWAIEDARQESETPLVTALSLNGMPLAYDAALNTFYCPLGLGVMEWPQLHLTAPGSRADGILFYDDYTYDWPDEAIAQGYEYELIAYDETSFSYFCIVFTGLPVVAITTQEEITIAEQGGHVSMATPEGQGLDCRADIRLRGDGSRFETQKLSYRISFASSRRNAMREVPGLGVMETVNLVAMAFDETLMHDRISWEMIGRLQEEGEPFRARETRYVELFVNGQYEGVYLMMEPIDYETEIGKSGSDALLNDSLYRTAVMDKVRSNAVLPEAHNTGYEHFYSPGAGDPFAQMEGYLKMRHAQSDEEFEAAVLRWADVEETMRYCALLQACGLVDNVQNNLFIWAHHEDGRLTYRFLPWDMDRAWGMNAGSVCEHWSVFPIADRMLNLNIAGSREIFAQVWAEMKEKGFTPDGVAELVYAYDAELENSGARMRNDERWGTMSTNGDELINFAAMRYPLLDAAVDQMLLDDGPIAFLSDEDYNDWYIFVRMIK